MSVCVGGRGWERASEREWVESLNRNEHRDGLVSVLALLLQTTGPLQVSPSLLSLVKKRFPRK